MADMTKSADAGLTMAGHFPQTRKAGVEIAQGDALYIDSSGLLQKAVTTQQFVSGSFGTRYKFAGLAARNIPSGTYGEVYGRNSEFFYADSGLTIAGAVYVSNTAGKLANAAIATNDNPVAVVVSATSIMLLEGI